MGAKKPSKVKSLADRERQGGQTVKRFSSDVRKRFSDVVVVGGAKKTYAQKWLLDGRVPAGANDWIKNGTTVTEFRSD